MKEDERLYIYLIFIVFYIYLNAHGELDNLGIKKGFSGLTPSAHIMKHHNSFVLDYAQLHTINYNIVTNRLSQHS